MLQLFGHKSVAFFDVWTIEHFISGVNLGAIAAVIFLKLKFDDNKRTFFVINFFFVLIIELFWEILEHYIEEGLVIKSWQYWFQGVECFENRMIADPVITMLGFVAITKFNNIYFRIFASIFSSLWLFFHIFIFPHSMYMQEKIISFFR